jgi:hypothetical protein
MDEGNASSTHDGDSVLAVHEHLHWLDERLSRIEQALADLADQLLLIEAKP